MKKTAALISALVMALALCGCVGAGPANSDAAAVTAQPAAEIPTPVQEDTDSGTDSGAGFQPVCLKDGGCLSADLDGDGIEDTVTIQEWTVDEFGSRQYGLSVEGSSGLTAIFDELYIESKPLLWLADINGDGLPEMLFSGDAASDDYYTVCLSWDGAVLQRIRFTDDGDYFTDGCVEEISGGVITIGAYKYVLGTYGGIRDYAIDGDGQIAPLEGGIWSFEGNETWLKTVKELPVTVECVGFDLPVGTELRITGFDGVDTVYFACVDDMEGSILLSRDDSFWGWLINGAEETEYFEFLPYAG